ncbi:hypothetical protein FACS1894120_7030 [Clostridia bacterium]|nr:hypothetical protein FACS1894120_7030 [Clostridia bacterium]
MYNLENNKGWNVTAKPDGTIINKADGLEYSYLYWEGVSSSDYDLSEGFCVKAEDTAKFLREKLSYLGLTPREYNEFIVYWLPRLAENKYNLIHFQTEEYDKNVKIKVTPSPDSIQRIFMVYQPLPESKEVKPQTLVPFERHGFTVIEWGGGAAGNGAVK